MYLNIGNPIRWRDQNVFRRMFHFLRLLKNWRLEPFSAYHYSAHSIDRIIETLFTGQPFDRVIVSELWCYPYLNVIKQWCGESKLIYDFHNVESDLQANTTLFAIFESGLFKKYLETHKWILISKAEQTITDTVDEIWVCSEKDSQRFMDKYGVQSRVVPNCIKTTTRPLKTLTTTRRIGFVGAYGYFPNELAALELMNHIHPGIRDSELYLIGKNPTHKMKNNHKEDQLISGEVRCVESWLKSIRTMVMPIRIGSGTRLKVLEAFNHGIPVVATKKAMEGLNAIPGVHYLRATTHQEFQEAIERLWSNPILEEYIRTEAKKLVMESYSWESVKEIVIAN